MKLEELKKAVSDELSSRNLKNPKIRGNALIKVCDFIKKQSNKYIINIKALRLNNISQEEISMKAIVPILYSYEIQHYR